MIGGPGDDAVVWNLPGIRNDFGGLLRALPAVIPRWLTLPVPLRRRWRLLQACYGTRGARLGALVRGPELFRRVSEGGADRIACFSAKDFALAELLAEESGAPVEELTVRGTQYFGEFAFELLAVLPYAYWLHRQGKLEFTVSSLDTRCLYYFSQNHHEQPEPRDYVPITEYPVGRPGTIRYDRKAFPSSLDDRRWLPPPYGEVFRNDRFQFGRETCIVCNKTSDERYLRRGFAVNSMDNQLLLSVVGKLRARYQVIYNRPRASDIVNDHQSIRETGDIEAVKRAYPDVLTVQELHARSPDLSFNELQLRLFANCQRFVSVLGGPSYLASYFGGTNVVLARRGWEVACGAFENWFDRFSGARVMAAGTPSDLIRTIERELL